MSLLSAIVIIVLSVIWTLTVYQMGRYDERERLRAAANYLSRLEEESKKVASHEEALCPVR